MKLHEIQSCIAEYQNFIANCSESDFNLFFESSDYCTIKNKSFSNFPNENLNLFLGIKDDKLLGFLVNENVEYTDWTDTTQIFDAEFNNFTPDSYKVFKEYYEKKTTPVSSFAIHCDEGFVRIKDWASSKSKWFSDHVLTRTLVKYFELPVEDFVNGQLNTFNFGLVENTSRIDLIVGNPAGLYDITRPVPPYEPKF